MTSVRFPSGDTDLEGYLAVPAGAGPWPGIVVVHDVFGFRGDVRDQADRIATEGYLVLAPSLYSRGRKPGCMIATMRAAITRQGQAFHDLDAARSWLVAHPECTGQVGILGFCLGGDLAMMCAPRYHFAAASVNYGAVPKDAQTALAGSCPVVGSWGRKDLRLRGSAARAGAALDALGVPNDVKEYPTVGHAFLNALPPAFKGKYNPLAAATAVNFRDPAAVEDAWRRIFAFFDGHVRRNNTSA